MPMKSSLVTGGITIGVTDLVPTVGWALGGCRGLVPASLSSLITLWASRRSRVSWLCSDHASSDSGRRRPHSSLLDRFPQPLRVREHWGFRRALRG